jgi:hypothetical protein
LIKIAGLGSIWAEVKRSFNGALCFKGRLGIFKERKMEIEAFLLCDAATNQQGKLNVLGAFYNIFAKEMPMEYPACAVAMRIRFERIEEGEHTIKVQMIDEDGKSTGPKLRGDIGVRFADDLDFVVANFVLNIQRLKFEKYGKYRIDLAIDGQITSSLPFIVRKAPNP